MKMQWVAAGMLLIFVGSVTASASERQSDPRGQGAASSQSSASEQRGSGRLRFRDGPVCMCSLGMSEEDIQRSAEERREQREQRRSRRY